jgi:transcription antitermination factor NusG
MNRLSQGIRVILQTRGRTFGGQTTLNPAIMDAARDRSWCTVFTLPQHEKSVVKHLELREVESSLPTCQTVRVGKNRQPAKVIQPLFPTFLFVRINSRERVKVLQSPGEVLIEGNSRECLPLPDSDVEFLRSGFDGNRIKPFRDLVIGKKVRIKCGVMQGVQGTLVRSISSMRFMPTIQAIYQHASVQVGAEDVEAVVA